MSIELNQSLEHHFGFNQFRQGQKLVIEQLLAGKSSLAIFPTGSGKSLCYQFTALHLPHLTLVVSPLLALMKDQLSFLNSQGIAAASIDSSLTREQHTDVVNRVRNGDIKILMVSVERFKNERFRKFISSIAISMMVVDEAHCISEWGHNFRPDYLKLPSYCQELNIPLVLLLTATATKKVKLDMAQRFGILAEHIVQTGFYRGNLDLTVEGITDDSKQVRLVNLLSNEQGAGIIYVTLQQGAENLATYLQSQGLNAVAYHAGLDSDVREAIQEGFMSGKHQFVVATIAFGMGIDKANIRLVVHYDLPKSIENYSQEIGRAGRDNQGARCITLANQSGLHTLENFVYGDTPEHCAIGYVIDNIKAETQHCDWEVQHNVLSTSANIRQLPLKTLLVQLELMGVIKAKYAYFAEFKYKFIESEQSLLARFEGERRDFLTAIFDHTQFKRVWGELDFDGLTQFYACDRARVITALEYLHELGLIELSAKRITDVYSVDPQALNNQDLVDNLYHYFKDKEIKEINRIQTMVRFFGLAKCLSHNLAAYFDDDSAPSQCGHCSVCRGSVATLPQSAHETWPNDEVLLADIQGLVNHMAGHSFHSVTQETCCRFLAGIIVPQLSRYKVKSLAGYERLTRFRYQEIRDKVAMLWPLLTRFN